MRLFIESIFDKDTDKLEDAKAKAIKAANVLEKQHGNRIAAKIFYFATKIDKLIIATGDTGRKAMMLDHNVLMVKEIPDIKIGEIPTKMARYQELVIPAVDFEEKKLAFTKIKDLNDEKDGGELGAVFTLTEIPNNNKTMDSSVGKVELLNEQPKFLQIKANDYIDAEISFQVMAIGTIDRDDHLQIKINGKDLILSTQNRSGDKKANIVRNDTLFYVDSNIHHASFKGKDNLTITVILKGYFQLETNVSILGHQDQSLSDEAWAYIDHSLELEDIKPFKIPAPYTNVATKVPGFVNHSFVIKKDKPFTDGITFGAVMNYGSFATWGNLLEFKGDKNFFALHRDSDTNKLCLTNKLHDQQTRFDFRHIKLPEANRPFYAQFSINFKTKTITVTIDEISETIDLPNFDAAEFKDILFGDVAHKSPINYITNAWYWIGDTSELQGDTKQVNA